MLYLLWDRYGLTLLLVSSDWYILMFLLLNVILSIFNRSKSTENLALRYFKVLFTYNLLKSFPVISIFSSRSNNYIRLKGLQFYGCVLCQFSKMAVIIPQMIPQIFPFMIDRKCPSGFPRTHFYLLKTVFYIWPKIRVHPQGSKTSLGFG